MASFWAALSKDTDKIEQVQRRETKVVSDLETKAFEEPVAVLQLTRGWGWCPWVRVTVAGGVAVHGPGGKWGRDTDVMNS